MFELCSVNANVNISILTIVTLILECLTYVKLQVFFYLSA